LIFQPIRLLLLSMLIFLVIHLACVMPTQPIIIDSMIYTVDRQKIELTARNLIGDIIDYAVDDFLYVLTNRYLYKIGNGHLTIKDQIPLPQRFNYLIINNNTIILITTNEIIILNKNNLAFKSGIGIEHGDYKPILSSERCNTARDNEIYLIMDSGNKTIMKILDIAKGKFIIL
jgi:hypothetical protein